MESKFHCKKHLERIRANLIHSRSLSTFNVLIATNLGKENFYEEDKNIDVDTGYPCLTPLHNGNSQVE